MRAGSLFSGVGGLDYGLACAGWEHAFFCESDPWRRDVLRAYWPGVPVYDDVRDVGASDDGAWAAGGGEGRRAVGGVSHHPSDYPSLADGQDIDLLCGGFPCQDLSVAGQRRGLAGARSGLFHEFARIIDTVRPRLVLLENVPGLLSSNGGRDFGVVLGTLADVGYGVGWRVLDSRFFGVPQRRRRVFIVAARADGDTRAAAERAGQILAVGTRCAGHSEARAEAGTDSPVAPVSGTLGGRKGFTGDDIDRGGAFIPVTHALTSEGADASEDGTGRGTPLVSFALTKGGRLDPEFETFVAAPLTSGGHPNSNMPGRRKEDDVNLAVTAFSHTQGLDAQPSADDWPTLRRNGGGMGVGVGVRVRRLTPTECERLQALPDGWTNPTGDAPDSRRYSALGDAVTASVAEWLGRRLAAAL